MKHILKTHSLTECFSLFDSLPMLFQPYDFYDGLVFHTRKSVSNKTMAHLFLENDLGIHYLGVVPSQAELICLEILEFMADVKKRIQ